MCVGTWSWLSTSGYGLYTDLYISGDQPPGKATGCAASDLGQRQSNTILRTLAFLLLSEPLGKWHMAGQVHQLQTRKQEAVWSFMGSRIIGE